MGDHERIWLQPECCACPETGRLWCEDADPEECEDGVPWTEYIRADLAAERIAELEARLETTQRKLDEAHTQMSEMSMAGLGIGAREREFVEALTKIANAPSEMIWGEDTEISETMRKMESIADEALAKYKGEQE